MRLNLKNQKKSFAHAIVFHVTYILAIILLALYFATPTETILELVIFSLSGVLLVVGIIYLLKLEMTKGFVCIGLGITPYALFRITTLKTLLLVDVLLASYLLVLLMEPTIEIQKKERVIITSEEEIKKYYVLGFALRSVISISVMLYTLFVKIPELVLVVLPLTIYACDLIEGIPFLLKKRVLAIRVHYLSKSFEKFYKTMDWLLDAMFNLPTMVIVFLSLGLPIHFIIYAIAMVFLPEILFMHNREFVLLKFPQHTCLSYILSILTGIPPKYIILAFITTNPILESHHHLVKNYDELFELYKENAEKYIALGILLTIPTSILLS